MLSRIHHIGLAVPDLDAAMSAYRETGNPVGEPFEISGLPYRLAYVETGGTQIELVQPLTPDSTAGKYLQAHPEGGVYHLAYEVEDVLAAATYLTGLGAAPVGTTTPRLEPDGSLVLVLDASKSHGTMLELRQPRR